MVKGLVTQSCPTLCKPIDCSPPGSSVHGSFQARILKWVAISSSRDDFVDCPWNSLGRNIGVGCHSLCQGIFPTQGLNSGLLHCRQVKKPSCNAGDTGSILVKELRSHTAKKQLSLHATTRESVPQGSCLPQPRPNAAR